MAFFVLVVLLADVLNVRLGVELLTLTVLVAAALITRRPAAFLRDWWFFLIGLVMWNLSGPIAANSPFPHHVQLMLQMDRLMLGGRDPVVVVQHALLPAHGIDALDVVCAVAYNMHLTEPYVIGYLLWRLDRAVYLQFAAAVLILLVLGFVSFIVFPAIPPWMASTTYGLLPNVTNRFGPVLHAHPLPFHGTPIFYLFRLGGDAVAAFPSEHAAFPLLESLAAFRVSRAAGVLLLGWTLFVLFCIVYLGEHWVTDALAGWLYAAIIWAGVRLFTRSPAPAARTPLRLRRGLGAVR